jgi:serpin B
MKRTCTVLLAAAALAVGCVAANDKGDGPKADDLKPDRLAVAKGNTEFALELYARLKGEEGNLFISPYSISTALAMTRAGARGDTAAEMDKVLHFSFKDEKLHAAFASLMKEVNGDPEDKKRGYQLSTANALWGQMGFGFRPEFLKLTNDNYGAGLREVDFAHSPEPSRQTINGWVEKETHDKIKDLLQKGDITDLTRLVLTNAIYFKGDWASQFKKDLTRDEPFHLTADKKADAPLMHQKGEFGYFDGDSFQALQLPYAGKDLTMVVLLPKKVDGLADLEKDFTADKLDGWLHKLHPQEVIVTLPKYKATSRFSLKEKLPEMGMRRAFSPKEADLSGLAGSPGDLFISDVIHKAFVDVNEEGTEAAAATAVIVAEPSAVRRDPPAPEFRADHPFLFLIRDTRSDSVLFLGRLADPTR